MTRNEANAEEGGYYGFDMHNTGQSQNPSAEFDAIVFVVLRLMV
jgi:hypothetical protein